MIRSFFFEVEFMRNNKLVSQDKVIRELYHSLENIKKDAYKTIEKQ